MNAIQKVQRALYKAANPSEATMRRETHYTDGIKRDRRVQELRRKLDELLVAQKTR